jgi:uncharacterized protein (TIGR00725 family)
MKVIIGVMGPGEGATDDDIRNAYLIGKFIAGQKWILLSGGRNKGVMNSASKGASENGGLTVGILPGEDYTALSEYVDIPVLTGMGNARNNINILTSNVIVAIGTGPGTISEISLAIKSGKEVILLNSSKEVNELFRYMGNEKVHIAGSVDEAIELLGDWFKNIEHC